MGAGDIVLGDGVFSLQLTSSTTEIDIALTRGGGEFTLEREIRLIEADGDYGPVVGRVRKTRVVPKLTMRALELLPANMVPFYPGTSVTTSTGASGATWAGSTGGIAAVLDSDFNYFVRFTGETKGGRSVVITVDNAINLEEENVWELLDKEEVVPEITFSGGYGSTDRTTEPWNVVWGSTT